MSNFWPTQEELDKALSLLNMDEAVENLSDYHKADIEVAFLSIEDKTPNSAVAVQIFAELAEVLNLRLSVEYGSMRIKRPKTREELESAVRSTINTRLYEANKAAAEK